MLLLIWIGIITGLFIIFLLVFYCDWKKYYESLKHWVYRKRHPEEAAKEDAERAAYLAEQEHQRKLQEYEKVLEILTNVPDWMSTKERKENNTPDWL